MTDLNITADSTGVENMRRWQVPAAILAIYGLLIGVLAWLLNLHFYTHYGPFYDSMVYLNNLARITHETSENGIWPAIQLGATLSTVFFPWLLGALLAPVTELSRELPILIQLPLVFLQLFTGYRFFRVYGKQSANTSALCACVLVSWPAIFHFNGGLPDFRMDLAQALGFGSFVAALAVARESGLRKDWIVVGLTLAVVCLYRSTTPVYISILLAITFLLDIRKQEPRNTVANYLLGTGIMAVLAGWYYLLNFDTLYNYYFLSNKDALASLPVTESVRHLGFIYRHIGTALFAALVFVFLVRLHPLPDWQRFRLNTSALLGGLVPAGYLILSGAGFNPFVSMASVPGIMLFMLHPGYVPGKQNMSYFTKAVPAVLVVAISGSVIHSIVTFDDHIWRQIPTRAGMFDTSNALLDDAKIRNRKEITVAFLYQNSIDGTSLINHLVYEEGFAATGSAEVRRDGLVVKVIQYNFGAIGGWGNHIKGQDDLEKTNFVITDATQHADYLVIADRDSELPGHHRINHYAGHIQDRLGDKTVYSPVAKSLRTSRTDRVSIYRVNIH